MAFHIHHTLKINRMIPFLLRDAKQSAVMPHYVICPFACL